MVTWKLKSCPKCGGDKFIDRDADGWYEVCLQCGHRQSLGELLRQVAVRGEAEETEGSDSVL